MNKHSTGIYTKIGVGIILSVISWQMYLYLHPMSLAVMVIVAYLLANLQLSRPDLHEHDEEEFDGDAPVFYQEADSEAPSFADMERRLQLVIEGTNDGIWDWDIVRDRVFWSDRVYQILGLDKGAFGENFDEFKKCMHPKDRSEFDKAIRGHLVYNSAFNLDIRVKEENNTYRFVRIRGKVKRNRENKPVRMAGSLSDITDQKRFEQKLRHNAYHDSLTLLPNRAYLIEELAKTLYKSNETTDYKFAVILVDLDKFKMINENFGHYTGDELLKEVGKRVEKCLRSNDILARIGGDEFAIIVRDIRQAGDATHFAQRLKTEIMRPFVVLGKEVFISSSMGIIFNNDTHDSTEAILKDANTSLSQAKHRGNASIEVYSSSMREKEAVSYQIEVALRQAIDRDQLYLVFQPIYNIANDTIAGFETLVRWKHPELGEVKPFEFIPVAEECGLILPIGEWILKKACIQMKHWLDQGFEDILIAVNVSAPQFSHQDVPNLVKRTLRETGLPAQNLKVEITESVAMKDVNKTIETLEHLASMGIHISIDDFGTGYSSLSYLKQYPIHTLKIDRSFVIDIPQDKDNMSITSTIIAMAKNLNLTIIAEGVETEEQLQFLKDHNCDQVQGFYYSKPLSIQDATELLDRSFPV